jgi:hypothetical protein
MVGVPARRSDRLLARTRRSFPAGSTVAAALAAGACVVI